MKLGMYIVRNVHCTWSLVAESLVHVLPKVVKHNKIARNCHNFHKFKLSKITKISNIVTIVKNNLLSKKSAKLP